MNEARRTIFRLNPLAADVFEYMMLQFHPIYQNYPCSTELCYEKSIFWIFNGHRTIYVLDDEKAQSVNAIITHAFEVHLILNA